MNAINQTADKKPKLNHLQEQAFAVISRTAGGYLKAHLKGKSTWWKLMDSMQNPIRIFPNGVIMQLIEKGYLIKNDHKIILK